MVKYGDVMNIEVGKLLDFFHPEAEKRATLSVLEMGCGTGRMVPVLK